jgi:copper chaperone CopZ
VRSARGSNGSRTSCNEREEDKTVTEVHFYVTRASERKDAPALWEVGNNVRKLSHVYGVEVDPSGSVVAVSFEGGRDEQREIESAIEKAGYEISRLSVRSDDFSR